MEASQGQGALPHMLLQVRENEKCTPRGIFRNSFVHIFRKCLTIFGRAAGCRYKSRGTLERSLGKPLSAEQKRCTYEHCARPDQSCQFLQIDGNKKTGGQDWSSLAGAVLCNSCYSCFKSRGTLERRSQSTNEGMSSFLKPESDASRAQAAPKPPAAVANKAVKRTAATAAEDGAGLLLKMAGVETVEGATADMGGAGGKGKRKKIASAKARKEEEEAPGAAANAKRASGAFA